MSMYLRYGEYIQNIKIDFKLLKESYLEMFLYN